LINPSTAALGSVFNTLLDYSKTTSKPLACTLAAGMMSVDMGGIINKIAYNYGLASIKAKDTMIMAAVMAGGMVPPIGIAISAALFKEKYTTEEKNGGIIALFMGLSFITEGALPYVITDFAKVIPSCIAGSAISGLMSSLFGCRLPAPHGGVVVLPVVEHPLLYLLSIFTGSLLTALLLGFMKKKIVSK
jgi:fructose-specific phosphotransferase system IIC component